MNIWAPPPSGEHLHVVQILLAAPPHPLPTSHQQLALNITIADIYSNGVKISRQIA